MPPVSDPMSRVRDRNSSFKKASKDFGYELVKDYVYERTDDWNNEEVSDSERIIEVEMEFSECFNNWIRNKRLRRCFNERFVKSKIIRWTNKWMPRADNAKKAAVRNRAHGDRVRKKVYGLTEEGFSAKEIVKILQEECNQNAIKTQQECNQNATRMQSKRNENARGMQLSLRRVQQIRRSYKKNSPLTAHLNKDAGEISAVSSKSVISNAVNCKAVEQPIDNLNSLNSSKDNSNGNSKTPPTAPATQQGVSPRDTIETKTKEQRLEECAYIVGDDLEEVPGREFVIIQMEYSDDIGKKEIQSQVAAAEKQGKRVKYNIRYFGNRA